MKLNAVKEICELMRDQLSFEASNKDCKDWRKRESVADLLNELVEFIQGEKR